MGARVYVAAFHQRTRMPRQKGEKLEALFASSRQLVTKTEKEARHQGTRSQGTDSLVRRNDMSNAAQTAPSGPVILESRQEGIAVLVMNRPDKLNALNSELSTALNEALAAHRAR